MIHNMALTTEEIAQLKELASLKDAGVLSEEEFKQQKESLMKKTEAAANAGTEVAKGIEVSDVKPAVPVAVAATPEQPQQVMVPVQPVSPTPAPVIITTTNVNNNNNGGNAAQQFRSEPYVGPITCLVGVCIPCVIWCPLDKELVPASQTSVKTFGGCSCLWCCLGPSQAAPPPHP